jgi:hypothetical protein
MWYAGSFLAGVATSTAMALLALRFGVGIEHPYWAYFASLLVIQALVLFMRNRGGARPSLMANGLRFFGQTAAFILGTMGAFYSLIAIYPPNM